MSSSKDGAAADLLSLFCADDEEEVVVDDEDAALPFLLLPIVSGIQTVFLQDDTVRQTDRRYVHLGDRVIRRI